MKYFVEIGETTHEVELVERLGELVIKVDGEELDLTYEEVDDHGQVVVLHEGKSYAMSLEGTRAEVDVTLAGHHYACSIEDERERASHVGDGAGGAGGGIVKSLMPGSVVDVLVEEGQSVDSGAALLILEAMKMQNEITAPWTGIVKRIHVTSGQAVAKGALLIEIEPQ